jgi:hypothetical protein
MARLFNGTTDFINLGTSVSLSSVATTVSCWVNFSALTNAYSAVYSRNAAGNQVIQLFVKSNGKLAVYLGVNPGAPTIINYDGTGSHTLVIGTWYHLAFVYDSTVGLIGYVNGAQDGTVAANGVIITGQAVEADIGRDSVNAGRFVAGSIADFSKYNVALTAAQIGALAQGARPYSVLEPAMTAWLPLDGLSSPEPDFSGNQFNGVLTGTVFAPGPPIAPFTLRRPQFINPAVTHTLMPQICL